MLVLGAQALSRSTGGYAPGRLLGSFAHDGPLIVAGEPSTVDSLVRRKPASSPQRSITSNGIRPAHRAYLRNPRMSGARDYWRPRSQGSRVSFLGPAAWSIAGAYWLRPPSLVDHAGGKTIGHLVHAFRRDSSRTGQDGMRL